MTPAHGAPSSSVQGAPCDHQDGPADLEHVNFAETFRSHAVTADQFVGGRRLRILVMVDDLPRECLALIDLRLRVGRGLDRLLGASGKPEAMVSDDRTEPTGNAVL